MTDTMTPAERGKFVADNLLAKIESDVHAEYPQYSADEVVNKASAEAKDALLASIEALQFQILAATHAVLLVGFAGGATSEALSRK